jgi:hypothetical protein
MPAKGDGFYDSAYCPPKKGSDQTTVLAQREANTERAYWTGKILSRWLEMIELIAENLAEEVLDHGFFFLEFVDRGGDFFLTEGAEVEAFDDFEGGAV